MRYITGHTADNEPLSLDWRRLADPDTTLVIYMGLAKLDIISSKLIEHGMDPGTPAAAIQQATTQEQNLIVSDLRGISNAVSEHGMTSPVTIIIGRVVAMADRIKWFGTPQSTAQDTEHSDFFDMIAG